MTSSLGNGAHAIAPGFEGARITPEQAEALAAGFLPSWEADGGPLASATNGHATGDLRSTMKSNGVHAESHAPPSRTRVSEPEDSVVIDRSITADQIAAPPPDSGRVPVATARMAAPPIAAAPVPPPAPQQVTQAPSYRPPPPAPTVTRQMPQRPMRPVAVASDDAYPAPKSKKGLFIGLGVGAAALLAIIIGFASSGGDSSKSDESGGPAITVVKPDNSAKAQSAPPTPTPTQTQTPAATSQPTTPPVTTPVTALPVAPAQEAPKAKPSRQPAAQPPAYNPPTPRAAPPPRSGGGPIVKDVPF